MRLLAIVFTVMSLSACSNWIYRIDIPQGNFLDQKDVDKLRVEMTKAQVEFVLGQPVITDSFDKDTWYYVYDMKRGMTKRGEDVRSELILQFEDGKLVSMSGDFNEPDEFTTPLDG
ncbi:MAG: outer membrane protein assembly factor BamE [Pseudomonadota bacterium]